MDAIKSFLQTLVNSPHYSFGWIVVAVLAILPAIVSANLIQHELSRLFNEKSSNKGHIKALLINVIVLFVSVGVISYAFYLYFWR